MIMDFVRCKFYLVALFVCCSISFAPAHKFYFSLTNIKIDLAQKSLHISCKLFIDDFENALQSQYAHPFDLTNNGQNNVVKNKVLDYIKANLQVYLSFKNIPLNLVGFEVENEVVWIYLEGSFKDKNIKSVKIQNTLLCKFTAEQTNLIQLNWNEKSYTEKLNCSNTELFISQ